MNTVCFRPYYDEYQVGCMAGKLRLVEVIIYQGVAIRDQFVAVKLLKTDCFLSANSKIELLINCCFVIA